MWRLVLTVADVWSGVLVFFFKQKTAYEMRISDWSSDVCSSDLLRDEAHWKRAWAYKDHGKNPDKFFAPAPASGFRYLHDSFGSKIGRASCRERVCQYV